MPAPHVPAATPPADAAPTSVPASGAAPAASTSSIPATARIIDAASPQVRIDYDGSSPPAELLDALRRQGWLPLHHLAPPAGAIDWSRPDPTQRGGYAVRPYEARAIGTFTGDRDACLLAMRRAQATVDDLLGDGAAPPRVVAITVVAPVATASRTTIASHATILREWAHRSARQASYRGQVASAEKSVHTFVVQVSRRLEAELARALAPVEPVWADPSTLPAPPERLEVALFAAPDLVVVEVPGSSREEVVRHLQSVADVEATRTTGRTIQASYRGVKTVQRHEMTTLTVAVPATLDLAGLERDLIGLGANAVRRLDPPA